jgi:hypothetical protein
MREMGLACLDLDDDDQDMDKTSSSASSKPPLKLVGGPTTTTGVNGSSPALRLLSRPVAPWLRRFSDQPAVAGPNPFDRLPNELVHNVFRWLNKASLCHVSMTCRRFASLAADESFWRRVDLGSKRLIPGTLGIIMARGARVVRAARTTLPAPVLGDGGASPCWSRVPKHFSARLTHIDFSSATIDANELAKVFEKCRELT